MLFIFYFKEKYRYTYVLFFFWRVRQLNLYTRMRVGIVINTEPGEFWFLPSFLLRICMYVCMYVCIYVFYVSKKPSGKVIYYSCGSGGVGRKRGPAAARVITRASDARHRRSDRICPSIVYLIYVHTYAQILKCVVVLCRAVCVMCIIHTYSSIILWAFYRAG
jgi:hypothetical protein